MKQNFIAFSVFVILVNPLFGQWVKTAFPCDCTIQDVHVRGDDVFAFGVGTGMMRSSDQGQTWEDAMTGITSFLVQKIASNDQYMFAATFNGVFRSSDNGDNWEQLSMGINPWEFSSVAARGSTVVACASTRVFYSTNNGDSWTLSPVLLSSSTGYVFDAILLDSDSWVISGSENVALTNDAGSTWSEYVTGANFDLMSIVAYNDTLYVGSTGDGIFKSDDQGVTWVLEDSYPAEITCNSNITDLLVLDDQLFVSNNNCGVAVKDRETGNWSYINENLGDLYVTALAGNDQYLYGATNQKGLWRLALTTNTTHPTKAVQLSLAPNPATGIVYLSSQSPQMPLQYYVTDLTGKPVTTAKEINQGVHQTAIPVDHLAAGYYFVVVRSDDGRRLLPFVVVQ